jgi:hypothetical protein
MSAAIQITRVSDGATRMIIDVHVKDDEHGAWQYTTGNYACDCNRHLFFRRAANEPDEDIACGYGRYRVKVIILGRVILDENEDS